MEGDAPLKNFTISIEWRGNKLKWGDSPPKNIPECYVKNFDIAKNLIGGGMLVQILKQSKSRDPLTAVFL